MASRSGRQAIFLVKPPEDWKPQRPWSVPPAFTDGVLVAAKKSPREAASYARLHNKQALERQQRTKEPIPTWAVVFRFLKASWHGTPAPKGGAA